MICIAFFTWYCDTLSWIKAGALFQMQMASLMAILCSRFEPPVSTGLPLTEALVEAPSMGFDCWMIFRGCCSSFRDFHISSNLILALIWLTDNMLNFSRSDLIEILSFTFVLFIPYLPLQIVPLIKSIVFQFNNHSLLRSDSL